MIVLKRLGRGSPRVKGFHERVPAINEIFLLRNKLKSIIQFRAGRRKSLSYGVLRGERIDRDLRESVNESITIKKGGGGREG